MLFFLTIIAYLITWMNGSGDDGSMVSSVIINFIFFAIIVFLCRRWKTLFFKPLMNIMEDLTNLKEHLADAQNNDTYDSMLEYMKNSYEEIFKTEYVRNSFKKYLKELELLEVESAEEYNNCDISDFINYEDICISVKKGTAENIATSMTGLGILGTFVGLAFGLQFFDASDAQAMAESIVPLIDGIKTAFYTSIYGVVVSLVLSHQFKKRLNELEVSLDEFYNTYYDNVMVYPEYMLEKQTFDIQAEQKEILSSFAESISVSLSREMKDMMVPIFEKFSYSIENFSQTLANNQVEGLEKIVGSFVSNMNESLDNQFDALGDTIKNTCEWQRKSVEAMETVIEGITSEADKIKSLNNDLSITIEKFDDYLKKLSHEEDELMNHLEAYKFTVDKTFNSLNEVSSVISDLSVKEQEILDTNRQIFELFKENNQSALESQNKMFEMNRQMILDSQNCIEKNMDSFTDNITKSVSKLIEYTDEKFGTIRNTLMNIDEKIADSGNILTDVYVKLQDDVDTSLERTFEQFDKELANMTSYFSSALVDINDNTEKIPRIVEASYDQLRKQTSTYIKLINSLETQIGDAVANIAVMNSLAEKHAIEHKEIRNNGLSEKNPVASQNKVGE